MNRELIEHYEQGGEKLSQAIRGLTRDDLLAPPPSEADVGRWTIQQVVLHLLDTEQVDALRIKFVIAEDNPTLQGFDQERWLAALHYDKHPVDEAVKLVELTRSQLARILRKLPDAAFERTGIHTEYGPHTLAQLIQVAVKHLEHHVSFIHRKRAAMGKEMW